MTPPNTLHHCSEYPALTISPKILGSSQTWLAELFADSLSFHLLARINRSMRQTLLR
uniref:Uncharacterized protein n=1 Tax=Utricularia reniformis TaxID=192314 RepID=A0A1Y0B360_9LAMI|nr:hypothetical protein AEK19_MT1668 [Utricularia reniformis]ART31850.1 hypothetical protein AEK19_MT1668 [Utricularia reniformis]